MPRRPPRKPAPGVDLSAHLVLLESLEAPVAPGSLFPSTGPVELEVGSGKGLFLLSASAAEAGRNFLGAEIAVGYARLCAAKLAAAGRPNARIIQGDAGYLVRSLLPDACLDGMHVYFPDPWWKARHRKRRVLSEPFLLHAGRVLKPGTILHVWTDVEEYFEEAMAAAAATGVFAAPREEVPTDPAHDLDYRTHFERRTRLAGMPVWRAALERTTNPPGVERIRPSKPPAPAGG